MLTSVRRLLIGLAALLLIVFLYVVNLGVWINNNIVDSETFVDTTVEALTEEESRLAISALIVDELSEGRPVVTLFSDRLVPVFAELLDSDVLDNVVTEVATRLHTHIIEGTGGSIVLDLTGIEPLIRAALIVVAPEVEEEIEDDAFEEVVIVEETGLPDASPVVDVARTLTIIAAVVSAALIFLIFALAKPRMLGLIPVGVAVSLSASITAFLVPGGRSLIFSVAEDARVDVVVTNLYDALVHALQRQSRFLLLIGVSMAVIGVLQWLQMRREADRAEA